MPTSRVRAERPSPPLPEAWMPACGRLSPSSWGFLQSGDSSEGAAPPSSSSSAFLQEFPPLPSHKLCRHPVLTDFYDFKAASSGSSNTLKLERSQPASHLASAPAAVCHPRNAGARDRQEPPDALLPHPHIPLSLALSSPPSPSCGVMGEV